MTDKDILNVRAARLAGKLIGGRGVLVVPCDELTSAVLNAIKELSEKYPRDAAILTFIYGLGDLPRMTFEAVAKIQGGVSRERIRQIESRAIRRLTHPGRYKSIEAIIKFGDEHLSANDV